jgi:hypothetical protein
MARRLLPSGACARLHGSRQRGGALQRGRVTPTKEGTHVTDRLLRTIPGVFWDIRILWRLDNDAWHAFRDAPDHVVSRWAATDPGSVHTHQLQNGILEARDELSLRVDQLSCEPGGPIPAV